MGGSAKRACSLTGFTSGPVEELSQRGWFPCLPKAP